MKLEVYLAFDGNCEEAMNFYKGVFGEEIVGLQRFSENPGMSISAALGFSQHFQNRERNKTT